tara:strand:- start:51 stop:560 length:510 start_codon:yes stop_codon:yes gene_type:complete
MKNLIQILLFSLICNSSFASFPTFTNSNECDNIILQDGNEIYAKVIEITPDLIKYKKCDNSGPLISIKKDDVFMIKYSDGSKKKIESDRKSNSTEEEEEEQGLRHGGFAVTALICGILGFIIPGLGLLSIIFGAIGASKKYKRNGMAITGMILGLANIILVLILILFPF